MKEFTINKNEANQRFDKYLKKLLPGAGSGFLYKMLRKKNITLNGKKAEGTEILREKDQVKLFFSDETYEKFAASQEAVGKEYELYRSLSLKQLEIVYEDSEILAANKPANMLSQKAEEKDASANERLIGYLIRKGELTQEQFQTFHPSVCNRLDRNTTGLILMGKTMQGLQELSAGLKNRSIQKYYRAIVLGHVSGQQHMKGYLWKDEENNKVLVYDHPVEGAVYAETSYEPLWAGKEYSLLEIHLITGKTHQIRAHLASIGHPVAGDLKYGNEEVNLMLRQKYGINHQLLHAYRLEMPAKEDGTKGMVLIAEPPALFERIERAERSERTERTVQTNHAGAEKQNRISSDRRNAEAIPSDHAKATVRTRTSSDRKSTETISQDHAKAAVQKCIPGRKPASSYREDRR